MIIPTQIPKPAAIVVPAPAAYRDRDIPNGNTVWGAAPLKPCERERADRLSGEDSGLDLIWG
jgi:antitoxin (DNA-binding transcriptional repressor) of toxin-antitoxin stability system